MLADKSPLHCGILIRPMSANGMDPPCSGPLLGFFRDALSVLAGRQPLAQVDPWEKAADCERAIRITLDPLHRETLTNIREFWIALAHKSRFLSDDALATQIETIGRLHAKLDRDAHP